MSDLTKQDLVDLLKQCSNFLTNLDNARSLRASECIQLSEPLRDLIEQADFLGVINKNLFGQAEYIQSDYGYSTYKETNQLGHLLNLHDKQTLIPHFKKTAQHVQASANALILQVEAPSKLHKNQKRHLTRPYGQNDWLPKQFEPAQP